MNDAMTAIAELSSSMGQARPSDRRLGEELANEGRVDFEPATDGRLEAIVSGPAVSRRRVTFHQGPSVRWSCTCMKASSPWCKHVVAAMTVAGRSAG